MPASPSPYGFSLIEYKGGKFRASVSQYNLESGYLTALAQGDPISPLSAGLCGVGVPGGATPAPYVPPPLTNTLLGIFNNVSYTNQQGQSALLPYWSPGTLTQNGLPAQLTINDLPYCIFQIQTNGAFPGVTSAGMAFVNADFVPGTPNPATGQSTAALQVTDIGTGNAYRSLKIVGLADPVLGSTNQWTDNFVDVLVIINSHVYKAPTTGI